MKRFFSLLLNDNFIGALILINALVIIYLCFDNIPFANVFVGIDNVITLLFACEIICKIYFLKKGFWASRWSIFDFTVVSLSFLSLILIHLGAELSVLENITILRVCRLFKFFRVMRAIPNIDKIFSDLKKAIRVTSGIIIGGFIILVIVGVMLCSLYKNTDPVNFGDPLVSMYTVFRLFSVEGWYEIPDAMAENTGYASATFIRVLFSVLVLFGMFMLGFILSSISDELAADNNDELLEKLNRLEGKVDELLRNKT